MHPQTAKGALTNGRNTFRSKELMQASLFTRLNGALDEWLSQRSAKPSTAVRIRQAPHYKVLRPRQTKGFQDFSFQKFYANVPILTYPHRRGPRHEYLEDTADGRYPKGAISRRLYRIRSF